MITARQGEVSVPLYWELLDNKSGNSSSENRIDLLQRCIDLLGAKRIRLVVGDWEFVGHKWLKYLKDQGIGFCMRLPKHHLVERYDGQLQSALEILGQANQVSLSGALIDRCGQLYGKRWTIECFFPSLEKSRF